MSASRFLPLLGLTLILGSMSVDAALVWRPGEGWSDEKGSDISASSSHDQLEVARKLEEKGDLSNAYKAYRGLIRRWPLSFSAPEAQFKVGVIEEKKGNFWPAYKAYQRMVEKYPASTFFDQAVEREFAIGNLYLAGEPQRVWKIPLGNSPEKTLEIYQNIIKNAPYGKYAAQAQFKIGLTHEHEKKYSDAVKAYNTLIEKYPGNPIVDSAQYQIGYAWMRASSEADYDQSAAEKAIEAFQDFIVRYPNSEKVGAARDNIAQLTSRRTQGALNIAQFYERQHNLKAAFIYYNEVVRQEPNSTQAQIAKKKVQELRPIVEAKTAEAVPAPSKDTNSVPQTSVPATPPVAQTDTAPKAQPVARNEAPPKAQPAGDSVPVAQPVNDSLPLPEAQPGDSAQAQPASADPANNDEEPSHLADTRKP